VRVRWKRHAGWIAVALGVLSLALLAVVGFQAWMLRSQGWRIVLGALPDWVTAVLTGVTAFGVLAAFGTLRIGRKEWETHQKERRDQQANQARLIIVEALKRADMVPPANTAAVMPDGRPEYRYVVIRNHSQEPVFNVQIADGAYDEAKTNMPWITSTAEVRVQEEDGSSYSPTPTLVFRHTPELIPVLAPGDISAVSRQRAPRQASNGVRVLHLHGCARHSVGAVRKPATRAGGSLRTKWLITQTGWGIEAFP
jgi:membrane protein implicated in regulation of membrane protease activity